ncbi:hypothetical protein ACEPAI_10120 [Sanghuangporus weigelae]
MRHGENDALLPLDIFEMIIIQLGKTDLISFACTSRYWRDRDKSRARRSKELLERMASPVRDELDIARLVRELRVIIAHESFMDSKEKECLLLTLKRLPEL